MQRIIGLDIGSYSIKAVEIINSFSSYHIENFYEKVISTDSPDHNQMSKDERLVACMKELFESNQLEADRIVTAMPGQYISSRMLKFPFSDQRKIAASVAYQVEDMVPFQLDDMILEHQIIGTEGTDTQVLVVMIQKTFMANYLAQLALVGVDPKLVDVDSLSLYNLAPHIPHNPEEIYGIIDIGHEKTSVCLIENDMLRMFRTLKVGGKYLTEVLARDLEISYAESQNIKHELSAIASKDGGQDLGLSAKDLEIARQIGVAGYGFSRELSRTLYAFKNLEKRPISKIYISGGTAKLRGIDAYLEEQLNTKVLRHEHTLTDLQLDSSLKEYLEVIPQAVSIGLRVVSGTKKSSKVNLRKGEFAYSQDSEAFLKLASRTMVWVSLATLLLIFGYIFQKVFYDYQVDAFEKRYLDAFLQIAPDQRTQATKLTSFPALRTYAKNHLQQNIDGKKISVDKFIKTNSSNAAMRALMILSETIPKNIKVDIVLYDFATQNDLKGKLVLQGETDGYGSVSQIKDLIQNHPNFLNVSEKSSAKPGTDGKVIAFTITSTFVPSPV
ncbi:MAG: type II secretion system protein GspL [Proteobacteria bacterium]|nr:type II secretion system protein GspL [Pseudomonadota bacterium]